MERLNNLLTERFGEKRAAKLTERFQRYMDMTLDWNEKVNMTAITDPAEFVEKHFLDSLAVMDSYEIEDAETIVDIGTGGGFPGIPLAVLFPACRFTLCDSIGKKIKVAQAAADGLGLGNVECVNARAEALPGRYDYVVSRAVTDLASFWPWVRDKFSKAVFYLKGGDLDEEIAACARRWRLDPARFYQAKISAWFDDPWFEEKKIVVISQ